MSEEKNVSNAKVFLPVFALAVVLRIAFDIYSRNWMFTSELVDVLSKLLPGVLIGIGFAFFWKLFRRKK